MYEDALKHLEENSKYILDKLKLEEIKGIIQYELTLIRILT